ncbi:MAG: hypothetical protein RBT47_00230 [Anaerolineae bacterium]|nr:hypothetical protein [Anaerolineae bacterium]
MTVHVGIAAILAAGGLEARGPRDRFSPPSPNSFRYWPQAGWKPAVPEDPTIT